LTALGRNFDESKIKRADDGKFGSGPGSATPAKNVSDDSDDDDGDASAQARPSARDLLDTAKERHENAREAHERAQQTSKKAEVYREKAHGEIERFHVQHEKNQERARELITHYSAEEKSAKADVKKLDAQEAVMLKEKGIPELKRDDIAALHNARSAHAKQTEAIKNIEAKHAANPPEDRQQAAQQRMQIDSARDHADRLQRQIDARADSAAGVADEDVRLILQADAARDRLDRAKAAKADLTKSLKAAPKETALYNDLNKAVAADDVENADRILEKIERSRSLQADLAEHDPEYSGGGIDIDEAFGLEYKDSVLNFAKAKKGESRAKRALDTHAKILERRKKGAAGEIDADGDGRTGTAEEKDDE
jgi:hypothetical protein